MIESQLTVERYLIRSQELFMFVKELHRAGHTKRFSVEQQGGEGWDVRLEQDDHVLKQTRYTDWHRVERAMTRFALEIGELEDLGWRG